MEPNCSGFNCLAAPSPDELKERRAKTRKQSEGEVEAAANAVKDAAARYAAAVCGQGNIETSLAELKGAISKFEDSIAQAAQVSEQAEPANYALDKALRASKYWNEKHNGEQRDKANNAIEEASKERDKAVEGAKAALQEKYGIKKVTETPVCPASPGTATPETPGAPKDGKTDKGETPPAADRQCLTEAEQAELKKLEETFDELIIQVTAAQSEIDAYTEAVHFFDFGVTIDAWMQQPQYKGVKFEDYPKFLAKFKKLKENATGKAGWLDALEKKRTNLQDQAEEVRKKAEKLRSKGCPRTSTEDSGFSPSHGPGTSVTVAYASDGVVWCKYGKGHKTRAVLTPTDENGNPITPSVTVSDNTPGNDNGARDKTPVLADKLATRWTRHRHQG